MSNSFPIILAFVIKKSNYGAPRYTALGNLLTLSLLPGHFKHLIREIPAHQAPSLGPFDPDPEPEPWPNSVRGGQHVLEYLGDPREAGRNTANTI